MLAIILLFAAMVPPQDAPAAPAGDPMPYDPMRLPATQPAAALRCTIEDGARTRSIPLRIYLPNSTTRRPVVLFSHGLGGSADNNPYLGEHWAARGYVVVAMQHAGSDETVWREAEPRERMAAMKAAASGENLRRRVEDVRAVLDGLTTLDRTIDHPLHGRLDLLHIGMSGHSFGAMTTQVVAGQRMPLLGGAEDRIDAALAMSPSAPRLGRPDAAFAPIAIPFMAMTGTDDVSPIVDTDVAARLAVYPALPATIDRYELVLHEAAHSAFSQRGPAFSQRGLPNDRHRRDNHHRVILALSTAFWDTHLAGDAAARHWLSGDGPRSVMEVDDRWQWAAASRKQ